MSWIQENKFVAGLAGTTAVLGGAILFFGFSQGGAYNEKLEKYEELKDQYSKLEKSGPYPTEQNLGDREDGIADYEDTIREVRQLVMGFRPEKLEAMSPEQFKDARVKMEDDLRQKFKASKTALPDGCAFGFEDYTDGAVKAGATAKLNYELGAIQWLLSSLAEVKPETLNNVRRVALAEEKGQVAPEPKSNRRRGRSGRSANKAGVAAGRAYELMPVELTFTASEDATKKFLMSMVNSKEYYYSIRAVRVRNEKQIPPNRGDADFPVVEAVADAGGFDDFGGMADDGGAEGEDEAVAEAGVADAGGGAEFAPGELILKQVLGNEKIHVHLCFDVVLIEKKAESETKGSSQSKAEG